MRHKTMAGAAAVATACVWALVPAPVSAGVATAGAGSAASVRADFNNDGIADLAVGVPFEDVSTTDDGAVNVIYGSATGLTATGNEVISQATPGIAGDPEASDRFGTSLAVGDFNRDGITDLAVGVPLEDVAVANDGAVHVIYGSATGLTAAGNQLFSQGTAGIAGDPEVGDQFGAALAAANYGDTGHADLAIGVPFEDVSVANDGAVNVLYGSATGLAATGSQLFSQTTAGIGGTPEAGDQFGAVLAAANLGNSAHADLAVGVPLEDVSATDEGAVNVIYGSTTGLSTTGNQLLTQATAGMQGTPEAGDQFGRSLAAADFGGSSQADLAVGVPLEDVSVTDDGAVNVIYGSATGLTTTGNQLFSQATAGIDGTPEVGDQFGRSLAAANFGGSVRSDLAVGVPLEDVSAPNDGAVNIIYGSATGLTTTGSQLFSQATAGIGGTAEAGDQFGAALTAANFGNGAQADLAVGVPLEDVSATNDGAVNVVYGSATGLTTTGSQLFSQATGGIGGTAEAGDQLGAAVAADRS